LVGARRAIVTDVPGTTRDLVTEVVDLEGLRVTLVDTAGLRDAADAIEAEGVRRARGAQASADLTLLVVDRSRRLPEAASLEAEDTKSLIVANKSDLPACWRRDDAIEVSATTGHGLDELRCRIVEALGADGFDDPPAITNIRHIALVTRAHDALCRARAAVGASGGSPAPACVLADLQEARAALEEISGRRAPEDLLEHIFSRFCIGKCSINHEEMQKQPRRSQSSQRRMTESQTERIVVAEYAASDQASGDGCWGWGPSANSEMP